MDWATEERDFVISRLLARSRRDEPRCYGLSSDALALYGLGVGLRPRTPGATVEPGITRWEGEECGRDYPCDESDLRACERTYDMAPAYVRERMLPVLEEFRAWVREGLNRHGEPTARRRSRP